MATHLYSYTPNQAAYSIVEAVGSATLTGPIELTVDLGNVMVGSTVALRRQEVLEGLQKLIEHIERGNWPPA
jgi:hypothetical protein